MAISLKGRVPICELARELDPGAMQGRLILMPANNVHAVISGTRTSPVDGLNFDRTFPGDAQGSITQQIPDFVAHEIFRAAMHLLGPHPGDRISTFCPAR